MKEDSLDRMSYILLCSGNIVTLLPTYLIYCMWRTVNKFRVELGVK